MGKLLLDAFHEYSYTVTCNDFERHCSLKAFYKDKLSDRRLVSIPISNGGAIEQSTASMMKRLLLCALASESRYKASISCDDKGKRYVLVVLLDHSCLSYVPHC